MITYKGDRFVKGKQFLHESKAITFVTKSKKGYVFESAGKTFTLDESIARSLKEVIKCQKAV